MGFRHSAIGMLRIRIPEPIVRTCKVAVSCKVAYKSLPKNIWMLYTEPIERPKIKRRAERYAREQTDSADMDFVHSYRLGRTVRLDDREHVFQCVPL